MEKKQRTGKKKASSLGLQTETLRRLDDARLQRAAGGGRIRIPVGFADDTTPIYNDNAG
jgi:hypothetical protein